MTLGSRPPMEERCSVSASAGFVTVDHEIESSLT